jgi:protein-S-isoprenylcysteine O-methyltransferase Ste14
MAAATPIYSWLIFISWLTLIGCWALSAAAMKRATGRRWVWWREIALRLGLFALVVTGLRMAAASGAVPNAVDVFATSGLLGFIGCVLCALGIGLAILARSVLSRNWSTPLADGTDAALVTTGPYAYVRHPIYGGMLLAMIGSAIGQSVLWLLPLVVYGPQFVLSARREESLLLEQFPERYRDYMQHTRMLLPFVL